MVAQLVEQHMHQLEGPDRTFREANQVSPVAALVDRYVESVEDLLMLLHETGAETNTQVSLPGAHGDDPGVVPALAILVARGEHDRVQVLRQLFPIGQQLDEALDVALHEDVTVSGARALALDRRPLLRVVLVARRESNAVLALDLAVLDLRRGLARE